MFRLVFREIFLLEYYMCHYIYFCLFVHVNEKFAPYARFGRISALNSCMVSLGAFSAALHILLMVTDLFLTLST